jgi:hypothetical protein
MGYRDEFEDPNSDFNKGLDEYLEDQMRAVHQVPEGACMCVGCGKAAADIDEYQEMVKEDGYKDADEAVRQNEGTWNMANNHFWCTRCYIRANMPLGVAP